VLPFDIPVHVGRADGRGAAARELLRPIYHRDDPTLYDRAKDWVGRLIARLLAETVGAVPGGPWTLLVIVAVVAAVIALAVWRRGAPALTYSRVDPFLLTKDSRTAGEMRQAADRAVEAGDWTLAVQERFRAVVRGLEERTIIDERPGWTAQEAAAVAGGPLPELTGRLTTGARLFDSVTYGRRQADAAMHEQVLALDIAARAARPRRTEAPSVTTYAIPR
jgi:Domain of unknown function (DUF4129)